MVVAVLDELELLLSRFELGVAWVSTRRFFVCDESIEAEISIAVSKSKSLAAEIEDMGLTARTGRFTLLSLPSSSMCSSRPGNGGEAQLEGWDRFKKGEDTGRG